MTSKEDVCDNVNNDNNNNEQVEEKKRESSSLKEDEEESSDELVLKTVFIGGVSIGAKSSMITRILHDTFSETYPESYGQVFVIKRIRVDGVKYRLEMLGLFFIVFFYICAFPCFIF